MAENDVDSGRPAGTTGTPKPGTSTEQDRENSIDAAKLQTAIDTLAKRLDEVDTRARYIQGEKDKTLKRTSNDVEDLKRKFAEIEKLKKSGLDEDTAFDELSFREDVRTLRQEIAKLSPAQPQPAGNGEKLAVDVAKVLADYQLDGNDPEVVEKVLKGNYNSPEQAELAALKLAYQRAKPTPPSPAATPALVGSTPSGSNDDKVKRLNELQGDPIRNRAEIAKLEKELGW